MNKEEEMGDLYFERPVNYPVSDPYGSRGGTHYGIDYAAPKGSSVGASERGVVVRAADNPKTETRKRAYGNVIVIYHNPEKLDLSEKQKKNQKKRKKEIEKKKKEKKVSLSGTFFFLPPFLFIFSADRRLAEADVL